MADRKCGGNECSAFRGYQKHFVVIFKKGLRPNKMEYCGNRNQENRLSNISDQDIGQNVKLANKEREKIPIKCARMNAFHIKIPEPQ